MGYSVGIRLASRWPEKSSHMKTEIYSLVKISAEKQARRSGLRARHDRHQAAWDRIASFSRSGASSATPEQQARIDAEGGKFTNEERAELETLDFLSDPPAKVFCYPSGDGKRLTGFMGNTLLNITHQHPAFRSNMGDIRQPVRAVGINGLRYSGTIFGTYARLSVCKSALKS